MYNSGSDEDKVDTLETKIRNEMEANEINELEKINSVSVKEAIENIKTNKSDPNHSFSSKFLKNVPGILYEYLATVIKAFLIHGHVTQS